MSIPTAIYIRNKYDENDSISAIQTPTKLHVPSIQINVVEESPYDIYSLPSYPRDIYIQRYHVQKQRGYNISPLNCMNRNEYFTRKNDQHLDRRLRNWREERIEWEQSVKKRRG